MKLIEQQEKQIASVHDMLNMNVFVIKNKKIILLSFQKMIKIELHESFTNKKNKSSKMNMSSKMNTLSKENMLTRKIC